MPLHFHSFHGISLTNSTQILSPGPNTPLGYQALLVSLIQLRKKISHECFLRPAHVGGRLPISSVTNCLGALRHWLDTVPSHLRHNSASLHPQHRRAVSLLHLRFWTAVIALTRPFLLFLIAKSSSSSPSSTSSPAEGHGNANGNGAAPPPPPVKRHIYEQMSSSCIEAAEAGVQVVRSMREDGTLSSLMLLDCHCVGEIMWILILALQRHGGTERQEMLRFCLETLKGMDQVGWCEKVAPELEARVRESGMLESGAMQLVRGGHAHTQVDGGMENGNGEGAVPQGLLMDPEFITW